MREKPEISPERAMRQVLKIFKERGAKALEIARKEILEEEFQSKEIRDALTYFMTRYWKDRARPTLLSLTCEAVGGEPESTIPVAVPMILISGGIDIHDDIIDESKVKAERPTVFGKFGKDVALVVGDVLLFKGLSLLGRASQKGVPEAKLPAVINVIQKLFFELADAEALEYQYRGRMDISPAAYLKVVWKKAGDVEAHTRVGAIIGGGTEDEITALSQYGRLLGVMILLRDDWLDMLEFEELRNRIRNECLPLPILYAAQNPKAKDQIVSILRKRILTETNAQKIVTLVEAEGRRKFEELMEKMSSDAYSQLAKLKNDMKYLKLFVASQMPSSI